MALLPRNAEGTFLCGGGGLEGGVCICAAILCDGLCAPAFSLSLHCSFVLRVASNNGSTLKNTLIMPPSLQQNELSGIPHIAKVKNVASLDKRRFESTYNRGIFTILTASFSGRDSFVAVWTHVMTSF